MADDFISEHKNYYKICTFFLFCTRISIPTILNYSLNLIFKLLKVQNKMGKDGHRKIHHHVSTVTFWCPTKSCHSPHPRFINTFLCLSVKQEELLSPSICYHLPFSRSAGGLVGAVRGLVIPLEAY